MPQLMSRSSDMDPSPDSPRNDTNGTSVGQQVPPPQQQAAGADTYAGENSAGGAAAPPPATGARPEVLLRTALQGHPALPQPNLLAQAPGDAATGLISVSSHGSLAASGATEDASLSNHTLYLGNLHPFVTEATLQEVFAGLNGITELKVIKDKATGVSAGYGFAKFTDMVSAQAALDRVNKSMLFGQEVRVNWAFQKEQQEELASHVHIFVGDLSPDVTDATLLAAFVSCPGCSDARVMWDHATGRSRGYGFVSFRAQTDAEAAIAAMHGQFVGSRRVRCGWAQHKTDVQVPMDPHILDRADPTNTNVYVGNLAPHVNDAEVRRHFGAFGAIAEVKLYRKGAYGFVRYKTHEDAVRAIMGMNGHGMGGKLLKCSWGRHPNTPPSGVQASLMLAAAAGIAPLGMGQSSPGGLMQPMAVMGGGTLLPSMGMPPMPMASAGAQGLMQPQNMGALGHGHGQQGSALGGLGDGLGGGVMQLDHSHHIYSGPPAYMPHYGQMGQINQGPPVIGHQFFPSHQQQ